MGHTLKQWAQSGREQGEVRDPEGVSKAEQKISGTNPVNAGAFLLPFPPFRKEVKLPKIWHKKKSDLFLEPKYLATGLQSKSHKLLNTHLSSSTEPG